MGKNSAIEWTDHTMNPWRGCSKVHEGCAHCYAEVNYSVKMHGIKWGPNGTRVMLSEAGWREPLKWNRDAEKSGERKRVFCASLADVFEDWPGQMSAHSGQPLWVHETKGDLREGTDDGWMHVNGWTELQMDHVRYNLFRLIDATPWLDWLLLTKRPENIKRMWKLPHNGRDPGDPLVARRENVWLGTSVSLQEHAQDQIPKLLECRELAPVLFLSMEPLLGPINLQELLLGLDQTAATWNVLTGQFAEIGTPGFWFGDGPEHQVKGTTAHLDWIIVGGESGSKARPMHPDWARSIRDQCLSAGVPFFFKQWGEFGLRDEIDPAHWTYGDTCRPWNDLAGNLGPPMIKAGKKKSGCLLDGVEWKQFPELQTA